LLGSEVDGSGEEQEGKDGAGVGDAAAAYFAPDGQLTDAGTGRRAQGRDAIREWTKAFIAMYTDLAIEKTNVLSDGTGFATEWVMTGVRTGDMPGLPATGRASASSAPASAKSGTG
jgi:SnoaL-like domain